MTLWTWWAGDARPELVPLPDFEVVDLPVQYLVALTGLTRGDLEGRIGAGNRCYVARLRGVSVAYGWVASGGASIGELALSFRLATRDCYLWDFQTLPAWRGHGIYPRLLQAILADDASDGRRHWISTAPENAASARGVEKAGFVPAGNLAFDHDERAALVAGADVERSRFGATLLGVPLSMAEGAVSPCWGCVMKAVRDGGPASCWPSTRFRRAAMHLWLRGELTT